MSRRGLTREKINYNIRQDLTYIIKVFKRDLADLVYKIKLYGGD